MRYVLPFYHLNVIKWDVLVILRMRIALKRGILFLIMAIATFIWIQGCNNNQSKVEPENGTMTAWYEEISNFPDSTPIQIGFIQQLSDQDKS